MTKSFDQERRQLQRTKNIDTLTLGTEQNNFPDPPMIAQDGVSLIFNDLSMSVLCN